MKNWAVFHRAGNTWRLVPGTERGTYESARREYVHYLAEHPSADCCINVYHEDDNMDNIDKYESLYASAVTADEVVMDAIREQFGATATRWSVTTGFNKATRTAVAARNAANQRLLNHIRNGSES